MTVFFSPRVSPQLKAAGEQYGIDFTGKTPRIPYTVPAHAIIEWASEFNKQWELSEAYYKVTINLEGYS